MQLRIGFPPESSRLNFISFLRVYISACSSESEWLAIALKALKVEIVRPHHVLLRMLSIYCCTVPKSLPLCSLWNSWAKGGQTMKDISD